MKARKLLLTNVLLVLSPLNIASGFCMVTKSISSTGLSSVASSKSEPATGSNTELWLDLRGTRLFPSTALQRLEQELGRPAIVDRVVLWDDGNANNHDKDTDKFVFVSANGILSSQPPGLSGQRLSLAECGLTDPMAAMETNSKGGWILVDSKHISDNDARISGINTLVELLVAGSAGGSAGVVLLGEPKKEPSSILETGGIAWTCPTKADVFHAATTLQSLQSSSTTTASGILVPSTSLETNDNLRLHSAVVLPFDELLWATAVAVFRGDEE